MRIRTAIWTIAMTFFVSGAAHADLVPVHVGVWDNGNVVHDQLATFTGDNGTNSPIYSYVTFDLSTAPGTYNSALFDLNVVGQDKSNNPMPFPGPETLEVRSMGAIDANGSGKSELQAAFDAGHSYGTYTISANGLTQLNLNSAIADLQLAQASHQSLTLGLWLTTATNSFGIATNGSQNTPGQPTLTLFESGPAAVPEPTSMATMGMAMLGMAVHRWRRRTKATANRNSEAAV